MFCSPKKCVLVVLGIVFIGISVAVGIYFAVKGKQLEGGVVSNGHECAEIGSTILKNGGSAVDSAIATLFCEGVALPQSTGLGGGFLMTIYIKERRRLESLNAREVAPLAAHEDMFGSNAGLAYKGGLSIAVPGELRGYWAAHQRYGALPWKDLVQPTIELCKTGLLVTPYLQTVFERNEWQIRKDPGLRSVFINPTTNSTYKLGDHVKRPKLAETLEIIARDGADALYNGQLTKLLVQDIREANGIITEEDFRKYQPTWQTTLKSQLPDEYTLHTSPLPGSGIILTFILNLLQDYLDVTDIKKEDNWQRIVESFKYAYAKRTDMGDPNFIDMKNLTETLTSFGYAKQLRRNFTLDRTFNDPHHYGANYSIEEDHGTAHVSILAPNGDAVSVTGTINQVFGAGFMSPRTGIILNDEMDDFSAPGITNHFGVPPSPANFIRPFKQPLSSMCPSIVVDKNGDVVLVIGAAGGTKITTTTSLVIMRELWFGEDLSVAVNASRLHHQLVPMAVSYEPDFDKFIKLKLETIGHKSIITPTEDGFAAVTAVSRRNGIITGSIDPRRGGSVSLL
uniref:Gamma-glutamyltransferase n=1 Tax=Photinus pyralis TaxID=7054 RepID=A0A1Y1LMA5_PHOPY